MKMAGWWLWLVVAACTVDAQRHFKGENQRSRPINMEKKFRIVPTILSSGNSTCSLKSTLSSNGVHHLPSIVWRLKKEGGDFIHVEFNLTKFSWNDNFVVHLTNGKSYKPSLEEMLQHHCTYHGRIREHPELTAYVNTCGGLRGQLSLGRGKVLSIRPLKIMPFYALKPLQGVHTTYYLRGRKMVGEKMRKNIVSIVDDTVEPPHNPIPVKSTWNRRMLARDEGKRRKKRWYGEVAREDDGKPLEGHGADANTRYVEVFVVAGHNLYKKFGDFWTLIERIKKILQVANALMRKANFFLIFTGLEVWDKENEVPIPATQAFEILLFKNHTQKLKLKHKFDLAVYLVGSTFSNLYGQSFTGRMCSSSYAYILVADVSQYFAFAATTLAHGLAHTLNISHDNPHCKCPDHPAPCIMSEVNDITNVRSNWSDCSMQSLQNYIKSGGGYCLMDRPPATLFGPTCGDGLIEKDEECDCGVLEYGSCSFSPCCDPITCKLRLGAVCSTGECCNTTTCQFHSKGHICRKPKSTSCDSMETCTGESAFCPEDVFINNGVPCFTAGKKALCYQGRCENHLSQCKKLYGKGAKVANGMCYSFQNLEGQPGGSCESKSLGQLYPPCEPENVWCGTLHCTHPNFTAEQSPTFMGGLHTLWTNYNNRTVQDKTFRCKWVVYDVGEDYRDPGLVQDGVMCAKDSMCIDSKCVKVSSLNFPKCPVCYNEGRCTNHGTCDCGSNFLPPYCKEKVPDYGFRTVKLNGVGSSRNLVIGAITGLILVMAVFFLIAILIRKIVRRKNVAEQFGFMRKNSPHSISSQKVTHTSQKANRTSRSGNRVSHNNNNHCNGESPAKSRLSPFSSPQETRKTTKIPSVRIYDISSPFLQSSTNSHLTELTAKDSTSNSDSNSTVEEQTFTPNQAKSFACHSTKTPSRQEVIYANDVVAPTANYFRNVDSRLPTHHDSSEKLLHDKHSMDQSNGEDESPASTQLKYENVRSVRVQKEEADKKHRVVYANSFSLKHNPYSTPSTSPPLQDLPTAKYDNIDDLISSRSPHDPTRGTTDAAHLPSFHPDSNLYATPVVKIKASQLVNTK